jgi:hypothetical protein
MISIFTVKKKGIVLIKLLSLLSLIFVLFLQKMNTITFSIPPNYLRAVILQNETEIDV